MKKIKLLKNSVTFLFGESELKIDESHVTQAEISENLSYGAFFSPKSGLQLVNLSTKVVTKVMLTEGCEFYTFQRNPTSLYGISVIVAHRDEPEGERFWQHDISPMGDSISDRKTRWR